MSCVFTRPFSLLPTQGRCGAVACAASICLIPLIATAVQANESEAVSPQSVTSVTQNMEEVVVRGSYSTNVVDLGVWNAPLREIPQSITVITEQTMKDQNMQNLSDALQSATGVTVQSFGSGTAGFLIRGFSTATISIDGVRTSASSGGTHGHGTPDLIHYQSVEVIRGPAGLLEGAGEPGGYVNMSRKRARSEQEVTLKG